MIVDECGMNSENSAEISPAIRPAICAIESLKTTEFTTEMF
jgi:hypothetical protein